MCLGERRQKVIRIISVLNAYYGDIAYYVRIKGVLDINKVCLYERIRRLFCHKSAVQEVLRYISPCLFAWLSSKINAHGW